MVKKIMNIGLDYLLITQQGYKMKKLLVLLLLIPSLGWKASADDTTIIKCEVDRI